MSYFKHESAFVNEPCAIGEGTKIWHFSHVMKNARIGRNCILGQNVSIANDVAIGNNVKVQNNVSVYTGTVIEDDVFRGRLCVLTNVTNPRSQVNRHALYEKTIIQRGPNRGRKRNYRVRYYRWAVCLHRGRCGCREEYPRLRSHRWRSRSFQGLDEQAWPPA